MDFRVEGRKKNIFQRRVRFSLLILCHLFVGLSLGLILYAWSRNEWILFALVLGAILPDLIDKPLGYLILNDSLANGRTFFHGLFAVGVFSLGAVATYPRPYSAVFACLAAGILSHQILDAMWLDPVAWLFPLLGNYVPNPYPHFFLEGFLAEITSPTEWIFGILSASILLLLLGAYGLVPTGLVNRSRGAIHLALRVGPWALIMAGGVVLVYASFSHHPEIEPLTEAVLLGISCLLASIFLLTYFPGGRWIGPGPGLDNHLTK